MFFDEKPPKVEGELPIDGQKNIPDDDQ